MIPQLRATSYQLRHIVLPKANRLHTSQEIFQIRKEGRRIFDQLFTLFYLENSIQKDARFAFVISSKVSKKATRRNRTKRLLRQAVHELLDKTKCQVCAVIVAKTDLSDVPLQEVKNAIARTLKKADLLA